MSGKNKGQSKKSDIAKNPPEGAKPPEGSAPPTPPAPPKNDGDKDTKKAPAEKKNFRIAVRISEILDIESAGKKDAYEQLKKMKLGDLIDRDDISFLG